jgi:hypothetical protein
MEAYQQMTKFELRDHAGRQHLWEPFTTGFHKDSSNSLTSPSRCKREILLPRWEIMITPMTNSFISHLIWAASVYYAFQKGDVAFFALDSNYMDPVQLNWLEKK